MHGRFWAGVWCAALLVTSCVVLCDARATSRNDAGRAKFLRSTSAATYFTRGKARYLASSGVGRLDDDTASPRVQSSVPELGLERPWRSSSGHDGTAPVLKAERLKAEKRLAAKKSFVPAFKVKPPDPDAVKADREMPYVGAAYGWILDTCRTFVRKTVNGSLWDFEWEYSDFDWSCCNYRYPWDNSSSYHYFHWYECVGLQFLMCQTMIDCQWGNRTGWYGDYGNSASTCNLHYCDWFGITCDDDGPQWDAPKYINLPSNWLYGTINGEVFDFLQWVEVLNLGPTKKYSDTSDVIVYNNNVIGYLSNNFGNSSWNLEILNLNGVGLRLIPDFFRHGNMTKLKELHLRNNGLYNIPQDLFEHMPLLKVVDLRFNKIDGHMALNFPAGNKIEELLLGYNGIPSLGFTGSLPEVYWVDLSWNRLGTQAIALNYDKIGSKLRLLQLDGNLLTALPTGLPAQWGDLECLWLATNLLEQLPSDINGFAKLYDLSLYQNRLTSLPDSFGGMSKLVQMNQGMKDFVWDDRTFALANSTQGMFLAFNQLKTLPPSIRNMRPELLKNIDLSGNLLEELPATVFDNNNAIRSMNLAYNELETLGEVKMPLLKSLDLSHNKLTNAGIPEPLQSYYPALEYLDMDSNKISAFPLMGYAELYWLDLSQNEISELPDNLGSQLPHLCALSVAENKLKTLPDSISNLKYLGLLDAFYNEIESIPDDFGLITSGVIPSGDPCEKVIGVDNEWSFKDAVNDCTDTWANDYVIGPCVPKALIVDLAHNSISSLPSSIEDMHSRLLQIDVSYNNLTELPRFASEGKVFRNIGLLASHNRVRSLPRSFFAYMDETGPQDELNPKFESVYPRLVDLSDNELYELPADFPVALSTNWLVFLDLSSNNLTDQPGSLYNLHFYYYNIVYYLDLHGNRLRSAPLGLNFARYLMVLDLSDNELTQVPEGLLDENNFIVGTYENFWISILDLSHNKISVMPNLGPVKYMHDRHTGRWMDQWIIANYGVDDLDLSYNELSGTLGVYCLWTGYVGLDGNNLTHVALHGDRTSEISMNFNPLQQFPMLLKDPTFVGRFFDGRWFHGGWETGARTRRVSLRNTSIEGTLEEWFCYGESAMFLTHVTIIDISNNLGICGGIPWCFKDMPLLAVYAKGMGDCFKDNTMDSRSADAGAAVRKYAASGRLPKPSARYSKRFVASRESAALSLVPSSLDGRAGAVSKAATDESSRYYVYKLQENMGLLQSVVRYNDKSISGIVGKHYSCAGVALVTGSVQDAFLDTAPQYSEYHGCRCDENYHGDPSTSVPRGAACKLCLAPGICPVSGMVHPLPQPGYWAKSSAPFSASLCRPIGSGGKTACSNVPADQEAADFYSKMFDVNYGVVDVNTVQSWCDEGYEGTLCSQCSGGYYAVGNKCQKCPANPGGYAVLNFLLLGMMFFFMYFFGFKDTGKWDKRHKERRRLQQFRKDIELKRKALKAAGAGKKVHVEEDPLAGGKRRRSTRLSVSRDSVSSESESGLLHRFSRGFSSASLSSLGNAFRSGTAPDSEPGSPAPEAADGSSASDSIASLPAEDKLEAGQETPPVAGTLNAQDVAKFTKAVMLFSQDEGAGSATGERTIFGVTTLIFHFQMYNLMSKMGASVLATDTVSGEGFAFVNWQLGTPECYFRGYRFFAVFMTSIFMPIIQFHLVFALFWITFVLYQGPWFILTTFKLLLRAVLKKDLNPAKLLLRMWLARVKLWIFWIQRHCYIFLFICFNSYMGVTPKVLQTLKCSKFDHEGESFWYLSAAPYVRCSASNGQYVTMLVFGIILTCTWVLGLPTLFFILTLFRLRVGAFLFKVYRVHPGSRGRQVKEVFRKFLPSILVSDSKKSHMRSHFHKYWESWKILLRLAISMTVAFIPYHSAFVPFILISLFLLASILQIIFQPFIKRYPPGLRMGRGPPRGKLTYANELEMTSLLLIMFNFCTALISKVPDTDNLIAMGILTLCLNVLFGVFALAVIFRSPVFTYMLVASLNMIYAVLRKVFMLVYKRVNAKKSQEESDEKEKQVEMREEADGSGSSFEMGSEREGSDSSGSDEEVVEEGEEPRKASADDTAAAAVPEAVPVQQVGGLAPVAINVAYPAGVVPVGGEAGAQPVFMMMPPQGTVFSAPVVGGGGAGETPAPVGFQPAQISGDDDAVPATSLGDTIGAGGSVVILSPTGPPAAGVNESGDDGDGDSSNSELES